MKHISNSINHDITISEDITLNGAINGSVTLSSGVSFIVRGSVNGDINTAPRTNTTISGSVNGTIFAAGGEISILGFVRKLSIVDTSTSIKIDDNATFLRMTTVKIKRSNYIYARLITQDWSGIFPDGIIGANNKIIFFSLNTRQGVCLNDAQEALLRSYSSANWVQKSTDDIDQRYDVLFQTGLLLRDPCEIHGKSLIMQEELYSTTGWNDNALFYHTFSMWTDMHLEVGDYGKLDQDGNFEKNPKDPRSILPSLPKAPPAFPKANGFKTKSVGLPEVRTDNKVASALRGRRSVRYFLPTPLDMMELSSFIKLSFGVSGTAKPLDNLEIVRRASASGGSLHPTNVFVLPLNVCGLEKNIYHYDFERHSLSEAESKPLIDLMDLAQEIAAGQYWVRSAAAMFVLSIRFDRNYWKYKDHDKAFQICLIDIGHVGQTCYIACQALGLGGCFAAAMSNTNTNKWLNLDGVSESALAFFCIGHCQDEPKKNLEPSFVDFKPKKAQ